MCIVLNIIFVNDINFIFNSIINFCELIEGVMGIIELMAVVVRNYNICIININSMLSIFYIYYFF